MKFAVFGCEYVPVNGQVPNILHHANDSNNNIML